MNKGVVWAALILRPKKKKDHSDFLSTYDGRSTFFLFFSAKYIYKSWQ